MTSVERVSNSLALIKSKKWFEAEKILKDLRREDKNNPEVWNLSGFAARNMNDLQKSIAYYRKALALDSNHRGALEYQGELFLKLKQLLQAKNNLAKLRMICGVSCEEYQELNEAINSYEKARRK